jgi:hypothetical protein
MERRPSGTAPRIPNGDGRRRSRLRAPGGARAPRPRSSRCPPRRRGPQGAKRPRGRARRAARRSAGCGRRGRRRGRSAEEARDGRTKPPACRRSREPADEAACPPTKARPANRGDASPEGFSTPWGARPPRAHPDNRSRGTNRIEAHDPTGTSTRGAPRR